VTSVGLIIHSKFSKTICILILASGISIRSRWLGRFVSQTLLIMRGFYLLLLMGVV